MASPQEEAAGVASSSTCGFFKLIKALPGKFWGTVAGFARKLKKLGQDDHRRIYHSLKVALAITLVSLFFYFKPLYDGFGVAAMWAVLTVVVVFEFSVGATIGKGLNRMLATLVAGGLGVGAHRLATLSGEKGEPILIAIFVFIMARYDYGLLIFILTFCLVSVSGYRDDQVIRMALQRLTSIIIGSCTSLAICICIVPVWIGVDLHKLVAAHLEKLGNFLEGFGDEYFHVVSEDGNSRDMSFLQGYKSVLTSKSNEENMANLARWEPGHGGFRFRHPWKQYLKVAALSRECAYKTQALHSYLTSPIQTPLEEKCKIQESSRIVSSECGKAMKELASSSKKMRRSSMADIHISKAKAAAENLRTILKSGIWKDSDDLLEIIPAAAVASLLLDVVIFTESVSEAVHKLASLAQFKSPKPRITPEDQPQLINIDEPDHHVIIIDDETMSPSLNNNGISSTEASSRVQVL
ncbi:hypothetical protein UlMin_016704 [Ulmus minor]